MLLFLHLYSMLDPHLAFITNSTQNMVLKYTISEYYCGARTHTHTNVLKYSSFQFYAILLKPLDGALHPY